MKVLRQYIKSSKNSKCIKRSKNKKQNKKTKRQIK